VNDPDALRCAAFILSAFIPAGFIHTTWLKSSWWRSLAIPLDFGIRIRGRRIFGENKMVRGFVMIIPAGALSFFILAKLFTGPWPLSPLQYAGLGALAGLGFMLGELPNSFVKRQFDIGPGQAPRNPIAVALTFVVDRIDSILGMLVALSMVVPAPATVWFYLLLIGPGIHLAFSALLYRMGVKARPA